MPNDESTLRILFARQATWPKDPRVDNGFQLRTARHKAVAAAVSKQTKMGLELVRFSHEHMLDPECVAALRTIGFEVEVFERNDERLRSTTADSNRSKID